LQDRHRPVEADVEHGVVRLDVGVGEAHRCTMGATDEVATGTEADGRTDGRSGDMDDHHQPRGRGVVGAMRAGDLPDQAPGSDARPGECRRRVDLDTVDHHPGRRVESDGTGELANRHRARIRPQLVGVAVGAGNNEARWSTTMHDDLWVDRLSVRKAPPAVTGAVRRAVNSTSHDPGHDSTASDDTNDGTRLGGSGGADETGADRIRRRRPAPA
jgi:hypothetical protein